MLNGARAWRPGRIYAPRMRPLFHDTSIPFRAQNSGDHPDRHLLADDVAPGLTGLRAHLH